MTRLRSGWFSGPAMAKTDPAQHVGAHPRRLRLQPLSPQHKAVSSIQPRAPACPVCLSALCSPSQEQMGIPKYLTWCPFPEKPGYCVGLIHIDTIIYQLCYFSHGEEVAPRLETFTCFTLLSLLDFLFINFSIALGFPGGSAVENPPAMQEPQETWVPSPGREEPLKESVQPIPIFLPGESPGPRSLAGYST